MSIGRRRLYLAVSLLTACAPVARAGEAPVRNQPTKTESGWDLVQKAAAIYAADKAPKGTPDAGEEVANPADDLVRQRATIARDAEALTLLRQALAAGIVRPANIDLQTDEIGPTRALTRLLVQESRVRAADKDWKGAAESALDSLDLSTQLPHGGALIHALAGWASESVGIRELRSLESSLPPAVVKSSAARLSRIDASRVTVADAVRGDRAYSWHMFAAGFKEPAWNKRADMPKYEDLPAEERKKFDKADYETSRTITEAEIAAEFKAHTTLLVAWAELPPPHKWKQGPQVPKARYVLTRMIDDFWEDSRVFFTADRVATFTRLLATRLAADAFHAEKNRWPTTLGELVPDYLPAVPLDPFSGLPLHYVVRDDAPLLYSVGPDATDDGGRPVPTARKAVDAPNPAGLPPRRAPASDGRLTTDSIGDIVFGAD